MCPKRTIEFPFSLPQSGHSHEKAVVVGSVGISVEQCADLGNTPRCLDSGRKLPIEVEAVEVHFREAQDFCHQRHQVASPGMPGQHKWRGDSTLALVVRTIGPQRWILKQGFFSPVSRMSFRFQPIALAGALVSRNDRAYVRIPRCGGRSCQGQ